jgi:transcriptional regulator with XRE-family HTH domain
MNGSSAGLTMVKPKTQVTSRVTREALVLLGQQIKQGRLARKLTAEELSTRAGISRALLRRIERGDPGCSIGAAFEAAVIAGVPLFVPEPSQLGARAGALHRAAQPAAQDRTPGARGGEG